MLKIRIKADLRCPKGHRVRGGNFNASCEACAYIHVQVAEQVANLMDRIATYQQRYPEKEADNEQD